LTQARLLKGINFNNNTFEGKPFEWTHFEGFTLMDPPYEHP
jgi:hypothetical protein